MPARRHLQHVIESAIDFAIIATDLDGVVTDWNVGAENILGWSREEMVGAPAKSFFTPEDQAAGRIDHEMRTSLAEGRANDERWHLRQNGSRFWASGEMMPLRSEDGVHHGYVKILRDRTRQREAGERLRENEDRYRTFLDTVETAFAIVDVKFDADDRPMDYRFVEANPAFERQTGVDLAGKWVSEFAPNLERFWFDTYGHVAKDGGTRQFREFRTRFRSVVRRASNPGRRPGRSTDRDLLHRRHRATPIAGPQRGDPGTQRPSEQPDSPRRHRVRGRRNPREDFGGEPRRLWNCEPRRRIADRRAGLGCARPEKAREHHPLSRVRKLHR